MSEQGIKGQLTKEEFAARKQQTYKVKRTFIGKPEDNERLVEIQLALLKLGRPARRAKVAA